MTRHARNLLGRLHLGCLCASFRGPEKEDRDRSGVLTRIDLSFPSLARVSSTLSLAGIRSWSASRATESSVRARPPLPCDSGGGTLRLLQPRPVFAGTPPRPPFPSGLPLRLAPSRSTLRLGWPKGPRRRSACAPLLGLRLGTDHIAARHRGDSLASLFFDPAPLGVLRRSTGRVSRRSPRSVCR